MHGAQFNDLSNATLKAGNLYSWVQYYVYSVVSQTMESERQQNRSRTEQESDQINGKIILIQQKHD